MLETCHQPYARKTTDTRVDVTAIIVNYNTGHLLAPAIEALRVSAQRMSLQIVLLDNASRDDSARLMREQFADCELIFNSTNVGFGRANNQALALARGRYVLLLNTDAFVSTDTLEKTVAHMDEHPSCGVLGVRLVGRDGVLQPSCRYFPTPWNLLVPGLRLTRFFPRLQMVDEMEWDHASVRDCDWVPGCYYLVRREVVDRVGLFDPRYFLYYEEVDHCRAVKAGGWQVVYYPHTSVIHLGGESAKSDAVLTSAGRQISDLQVESELLYFRKHHGLVGVWAVMVAGLLGDAHTFVRALLKRSRRERSARGFAQTAVMLSMTRRTAWGMRPTR